MAATAVLSLGLLGCSGAEPRAPTRQPNLVTGEHHWAYAVDLLADGDETTARSMLERGRELGMKEPLFLRDLAEVRLAAGDRAGATEAARAGMAELQLQPMTAQFRDEDRRVFNTLLESIDAAASSDRPRLAALADSARPPLADPWYLLGWTDEQRGDTEGARSAYRIYLDRSPEFDLLRRSIAMRRHARETLSAP